MFPTYYNDIKAVHYTPICLSDTCIYSSVVKHGCLHSKHVDCPYQLHAVLEMINSTITSRVIDGHIKLLKDEACRSRILL